MMAKAKHTAQNSKVVMAFIKSTKNTHVYSEGEVDNPTFPTVYVQKSAFPDPSDPPKKIAVTIDWSKAALTD